MRTPTNDFRPDSGDDDHLAPDHPYPGPIQWLTVPGRLLLIGTIIACGGLLYGYFAHTLPLLPRGSYPVYMWVVPVLLVGLFFFLVTAFLLERIGVRIYRRNR